MLDIPHYIRIQINAAQEEDMEEVKKGEVKNINLCCSGRGHGRGEEQVR
jgi:hypothetical protein